MVWTNVLLAFLHRQQQRETERVTQTCEGGGLRREMLGIDATEPREGENPEGHSGRPSESRTSSI